MLYICICMYVCVSAMNRRGRGHVSTNSDHYNGFSDINRFDSQRLSDSGDMQMDRVNLGLSLSLSLSCIHAILCILCIYLIESFV